MNKTEETEETHEFVLNGRKRTLFRRKAGGPWYIRYREEGGKVTWKNLDTTARLDAERRVKDIFKAIQKGAKDVVDDALRQRKPSGVSTTIHQLVEAFKSAPVKAKLATREDYLWALRKVIQAVHGETLPWMEHSLSILSGELIFKFKKAVHEDAVELGADEDHGKLERAWRSGNSVLRQARAMFSTEALQYYRMGAGLELPDMTGFLKTPAFKGAAKRNYQQPDDALIRRTLGELEASRETHPDRYLICWLALGFGLRKGEIAAAKRNWFGMAAGRPVIEIRSSIDKGWTEHTVTKNGQNNPRVEVANDAWRHIEPFLGEGKPGDYVIGGNITWRAGDAFREVNDWLRELGWVTEKGIHELRAYAGCQIIGKDGLWAASQWLRHGSMTTTQAYYGRYARGLVSDVPLSITVGAAGNAGPCAAPCAARSADRQGQDQEVVRANPAAQLAAQSCTSERPLTPSKEGCVGVFSERKEQAQNVDMQGFNLASNWR